MDLDLNLALMVVLPSKIGLVVVTGRHGDLETWRLRTQSCGVREAMGWLQKAMASGPKMEPTKIGTTQFL